MYKLDLEKVEEPEINLPTSNGSQKKQENSRKMYFCFTDYMKTFDCVDHNKRWKILKEMDIADHITCLLRKNLYVGQKATEPDMEQKTGYKEEKEYVKVIYCHSAYLSYMQSTSCEMPSWVKHKVESICR